MNDDPDGYCYLACPFYHINKDVKEERVKIATEVAYSLFLKGVVVFSPLTHNYPLITMGIENKWDGLWREFDISILAHAKKLYVITIPGWIQSRGVQAEISYAKQKNIPIEYLDIKSK